MSSGTACRSLFAAAVAVAAFGTVIAAAGCGSSSTRTAGVATNLGFFSNAPMPVLPESASPDASPPAPAVVPAVSETAATTPIPTAPAAASSGSSNGGGFASPTPCPLPAPQIFVHGTSAATGADGTITFSYLGAQRLCGGPDDSQYVTTTKVVTTATVDPSAMVLMLPPDGNPQARQIPAAALPAAMAANKQAPYYALTFSQAGSIIRIEQYFHP